ncbi:hypothetical protein X735_12565 [Mesorhizobium sp. L2C085B000]|uniref:hypothetical protein n=1 Tax=Mesorhizobium sp. L2C085B000 TaxID=1287117 RepID=UPI0003D022E2|nr:hypothetical protein [Mesorhizobium sp. L2C085B000]ESZ17794.1 hypothetical protein X735_12565 [Mesorhizobium sp. L2C085B000]
MSGAIDSAARLRRISACIREGLPIDPDDAVPFGEAIDAFFAGHAPTLDAALGLKAAGPGQADARRAWLIGERDKALRELAGHVAADLDGAGAEGVWDIFEHLEAYAAGEWPEHRTAAVCPHPEGGKALAWTILRGNGGKAPTRRWLADFFST